MIPLGAADAAGGAAADAGGAGRDEVDGDGLGAGAGRVPLVATAFAVELGVRSSAADDGPRCPLNGFIACHMPPSDADDPVDSEPLANRRAYDVDPQPLHDRDPPLTACLEPPALAPSMAAPPIGTGAAASAFLSIMCTGVVGIDRRAIECSADAVAATGESSGEVPLPSQAS